MKYCDAFKGNTHNGSCGASTRLKQAAVLGVLLASALSAGCGDAVVGPARAQSEAPTQTAASTEAVLTGSRGAPADLYSHIRPASVDEPLDTKQEPDIAG